MRKKLNVFVAGQKNMVWKWVKGQKNMLVRPLTVEGFIWKNSREGQMKKTKMLLPVGGRSTDNGEQNIVKNERNRNSMNQIFS